MIATAASINVMIQSIVDEDMRGRMMSFFGMAFFGMPPIGSVLQGYAAKLIPWDWIILMCGLTCMLAACFFEYFRPMIREQARQIIAKRDSVNPEIAASLKR